MTEYQTIAGLTDEEMMAKKPPRQLHEKRIMVFYMCYSKGIMPTKIGRMYGFTRATINYALKRCKDLYETDKNFKQQYDKLFIAKSDTKVS